MSDPSEAGTALSFALISVDSLPRSLDFYRGVVGLALLGTGEDDIAIATPEHELRPARLALLGETGTPVGRVLLVEFATPGPRVRRPGDRTTRGLWNLNFYVDDIASATRALRMQGYEFWGEPATYQVGVAAGTATEVVFEGPDGVAINLVDPRGGPDTFTGRVRAEVERHGRTPTGYTPVATTAHCVRELSQALRFYRDALGMQIVLDEILGKAETNRFLARPASARTHTVFLAGNHFYGKVSLNEPQNFEVPERVAAAAAPNVGYLAQGFLVPRLEELAARLAMLGIACERRRFPRVPGLGAGLPAGDALQLRIPGSGAYTLLLESS